MKFRLITPIYMFKYEIQKCLDSPKLIQQIRMRDSAESQESRIPGCVYMKC